MPLRRRLQLDPRQAAADVDVQRAVGEVEEQLDVPVARSSRPLGENDGVLAGLGHGDDEVVEGLDVEPGHGGEAGGGTLGDDDVASVGGQSKLGGVG